MTKYLLDTNIISNGIKKIPDAKLMSWLVKQPNDNLFISAISIGEIKNGILKMPKGKRRNELLAWFEGTSGQDDAQLGVIDFFDGRILPFDTYAAQIWAQYMSQGAISGYNRLVIDTMIGAIAKANNCIIVTFNDKDFRDFDLINPEIHFF